MERTVEEICRKCHGEKYLGKGKKQPCNKCVDKKTGQPTGKFKREISDGQATRNW